MRVVRWLDDHIEEVLLTIFSSIMVVFIFIQVVMRQLGNSLTWSEELARYCFIWLVYIGISYGVKKQRHIKVDVALIFLKEKAQIVLTIIAHIIFIFFALFVVRYGYDIATKLLAFGQKSPALHIPMGLVYMATPVGMGLTLLRLIQNLIKHFKALFGHGEFDGGTEADKIQEEMLS